MKTRYKILVVAQLLLIIILSACKKFVEVETPITQVSTENAFKNDITAAAVLTGIYAQISNNYINNVNLGASSFLTELSADDLMLFDVNSRPDYAEIFQNALESSYSSSFDNTYWRNTFIMMYTVNGAIEKLQENNYLSSDVRRRLLGESYFMRGFFNFYLVNLYGDIPLVLTTDYKKNSSIQRSNKSEVYTQISADLTKAELLLDDRYVSSNVTQMTAKRLRPNLGAVNALQARVFLYEKKYIEAEAAATKVILRSSLYSLTELGSTFKANSDETIWALQPVNNGYNTQEGQLFLLPETGPDYDRPSYLSPLFIKEIESGDGRKIEWIDSILVGTTKYFFPQKYKIPYTNGSTEISEYNVVMRLSEQYLIRSEARNELGNKSGAIQDINTIRRRSRLAVTDKIPNPLPDLSPFLTKEGIFNAILKERRIELFTEWAHRWFDLKRLNVIDETMSQAVQFKGGSWQPYKALYPIPSSEILLNPNLSQNPGYSK